MIREKKVRGYVITGKTICSSSVAEVEEEEGREAITEGELKLEEREAERVEG